MRPSLPLGRDSDVFLNTTIHERVTRDDLRDGRLHAVAVFGDGFQKLIHDDFVRAFKLAAQGIGEEFLRQVTSEFRGPSGGAGLKFLGSREALPAGKFTASGREANARICQSNPLPVSFGKSLLKTIHERPTPTR